jgi:GT2 family glycosyltransferase
MKSSSPVDISIIIVSWNAKDMLEKCLVSISNQSNRYQIETIVVDNASTDGAPDVVKNNFPEVTLIQNSANLGFAKANNVGISNSNGRYVCLINSDVVVLDNCLDRMCEYMDSNPEIGVLGPRVLNPDGTLQQTCRKFPNLWDGFCRATALDKVFPQSRIFGRQFMTFITHDEARTVDYLSGCFMMVRKRSMEQVGLLDEAFFFYAEDKDWCKRFWDNGWAVGYYPNAEAIHYLYGSSNKDPVRYYIQEIKANMQYYKKHHSRSVFIGYMLTVALHQLIRFIGSFGYYVIKPSARELSRINLRRSTSCMVWLLKGANI